MENKSNAPQQHISRKRKVIYNDDSQGVRECRLGHAQEDLEKWVDKPFSRIPIDTYAWCIALPDVGMHNSKVVEIYGARFDTSPDDTATAIAELRSQGLDVLRIVTDQAHKYDAEVVASVRMGDTHHRVPDPNDPKVSFFLIEHPEWVIKRFDGIQETAMDYSFPEVREHRLALLRELAEDYDIDGLELDFTRFAKFFVRHEAPFKIGIMNEFVGEVRSILDEAGRKRRCKRLTLGAQVQESLYLCHLSGLDPKTWIKNGWIDYIIQCDFNCTNPQIPVAEFAEFCKGSDCTHHVRMGSMMGGLYRGKPFMTGRKTYYNNNQGYGGMILTPEEARGAAANIYGFGADGIGLWNICCNMGEKHKPGSMGDRKVYQEDTFAWIDQVVSPERVWAGRRCYHFVPLYKKAELRIRNYAVNDILAGPTGSLTQIVWLRDKGFREIYRFLMADGQHGEKLRGKLRFRILQSTLEYQFIFDINGQEIDTAKVRREFVPDEELPAVWYEVNLVDCPSFTGNNELGMTMTGCPEHHQGAGKAPYMEELEVTIEPG